MYNITYDLSKGTSLFVNCHSFTNQINKKLNYKYQHKVLELLKTLSLKLPPTIRKEKKKQSITQIMLGNMYREHHINTFKLKLQITSCH